MFWLITTVALAILPYLSVGFLTATYKDDQFTAKYGKPFFDRDDLSDCVLLIAVMLFWPAVWLANAVILVGVGLGFILKWIGGGLIRRMQDQPKGNSRTGESR